MTDRSQGRLYDVTRSVFTGHPVWPGDVPCSLAWRARIGDEAGSVFNACELRISPHTGTHADGPFHVLEDGIMIGAAPLESYLGPAEVIDVGGRTEIDAAWLATILGERRPERVLFRTGCWTDRMVFPTDFAALTPDAAQFLVGRGIRLVGTDAPSPDPFHSADLPVHRILLGAGAAILENVLLDEVPEGEYELIALPLRLEDADSSPVRAVLREMA